MPERSAMAAIRRLAQDLSGSAQGLPHLWGRRGFWQVKLRWFAAPVMLLGVAVGRWLGFEFHALPVVLIALANPLYNAVFAWIYHVHADRLEREPRLERLVNVAQVILDYASIFLLLYFTGGTASPLIFFFLFHVIIGAIQFRASTAFLFAAVATGGLWLLLVAQLLQWIPCHCIRYEHETFCFLEVPTFAVIELVFFTATVFILAIMATAVMKRLRERVVALAEASAEVATLNDRLNALYAMVTAIGSERRLAPMLNIVTTELVHAVDSAAVAVMLLSEDGGSLRFVAAQGLPEEFVREATVDLGDSPLGEQLLDGETLLLGGEGGPSWPKVEEDLSGLGFESAVLSPLILEDGVIGCLGAFCRIPGRYTEGDTNFLNLAAELVAIAVDNARAYEAIQDLLQERARFTLQVAHNMRAPLGASLNMLELIEGGYLGETTEEQLEYVGRIRRRLLALHQTVGDLLTIGAALDWSREITDVVVNLDQLASYTEGTFRDDAARKAVRFTVEVEEGLPDVDSGANLLEQVMENLVSNAIKYTPEGGEVEVRFTRGDPGEVRITVRDTGIGIPAEEQGQLFTEFFRASNARRSHQTGTGLGLSLVKQTVERHRGRVSLESAEGAGTTVTLEIPVRQHRPTGAPSPG